MCFRPRNLFRAACAWAALSFISLPAQAEWRDEWWVARPGANELSGSLLVKPISKARRPNAQTGLLADWDVVAVPQGISDLTYGKSLYHTGRYEYVVPNWRCSAAGRPNDTYYPFQWHHQKIHSEQAWDIREGTEGIVVAVVDSGVQGSLPDFQDRMVPGFNAVTQLAQAEGGQVGDVSKDSHGTGVAALIAATGNNESGVCGMNWSAKVMPIRVTNDSGNHADFDKIASGANWAVQHGARIINASYAVFDGPQIRDMSDQAWNAGALVVYSAGNSGLFLSFDLPHLIVVGATDKDDHRLPSSNYGTVIDCMAPGADLLTLSKLGGTMNFNETSAAAAVVSGVAALMRSTNPYMSVDMLARNLVRGCVRMGPELGDDPSFGFGRIDAARAVRRVVPYTLIPLNAPPDYQGTLFFGSVNIHGDYCGTARGTWGDIPFSSIAGNVQLLAHQSPYSWANSITDEGTVVGSDNILNGRPCYWDKDGQHMIPLPPGAFSGWAVFVRKDGVFVGMTNPIFEGPAQPWLWDGTNHHYVEIPEGTRAGSMYGVSPMGVMTGWLNLDGSLANSVGCIWDKFGVLKLLPKAHPEDIEFLYAVNDKGVAVGNLTNLDHPEYNGPILHEVGLPPKKLDMPAGQTSGSARSINNSDQIVGMNNGEAALWNDFYAEFVRDLLVPGFESWYLGGGLKITERGWIVGQAYDPDGKDRFVLIKTIDDQGQTGRSSDVKIEFPGTTVTPGDLPMPMTIELIKRDNFGHVVDTQVIPNVVADPSNGTYQIRTTWRGPLDVRISRPTQTVLRDVSPCALTRIVRNVNFTEQGAIPPIVTQMMLGDIDGDNKITVLDYSVLSDYFDRSSQDTQWASIGSNGYRPKDADIDWDGAVTVFDYSILNNNFDQEGDSL